MLLDAKSKPEPGRVGKAWIRVFHDIEYCNVLSKNTRSFFFRGKVLVRDNDQIIHTHPESLVK